MSEGIDHGEKTVTTEGKIIEPRRTRARPSRNRMTARVNDGRRNFGLLQLPSPSGVRKLSARLEDFER